MQKQSIILIVIFAAIVFFAVKFSLSILGIRFMIKVFVGLLILSLFLYKQIKPHKNTLYPKYKKWFSYIETIYDNVFKIFTVRMVKLGNTLSIDYTSLIILVIFIAILLTV